MHHRNSSHPDGPDPPSEAVGRTAGSVGCVEASSVITSAASRLHLCQQPALPGEGHLGIGYPLSESAFSGIRTRNDRGC